MSARRILLVAPHSPFGECSGARQRTALFYETLAALAPTDVLVVTQTDHPEARADGDHANVFHVGSTRRGMVRSPYAADPALSALVDALLPVPLAQYDLVVGRYLWSLCQLAIPPTVRTIADLDDFRYRFDRQAMAGQPRNWLLLAQRRVKEYLARRQLSRFDGLVFASPLDRAEVRNRPSVLGPNVYPDAVAASAPGRPPGEPSFLFVGSMWYGPNRDGIEWFLQRAWPGILTTHPQARLLIVGAAPESQRQGWERVRGVSAPGFVDDLARAYADAAVVVVPVHYGGGTNIKVLEALAMGKPCVASTFSHRPFGGVLEHGRDLLVARDPAEFVAHCTALLAAPGYAESLAMAGQASVRDQFSKERFRAGLLSFVQEVVAG